MITYMYLDGKYSFRNTFQIELIQLSIWRCKQKDHLGLRQYKKKDEIKIAESIFSQIFSSFYIN